MTGISPRQIEVLNFIMQNVLEIGLPPSVNEICAKLEINSLRGATIHLDALERKGFISREYALPRHIKVLKNADGQDVQLAFQVKA
jgi:repressor LexA